MNMIWPKTNFMEKPFQTVIISKVELSKLNYPYSFHISWEEAAMWSYSVVQALKCLLLKTINFVKVYVSYATKIFENLWNLHRLSCVFSTYRHIMRKDNYIFFPTVENFSSHKAAKQVPR